MNIQAGQFQHPVIFERRTSAMDAVGQSTRAWAETARRWATIEPLWNLRPESETAASQEQSIVRFKLVCGGYFDCRAEDRIRHQQDGRVWGISQVLGREGKAPLYADEITILAWIGDQMEEAK